MRIFVINPNTTTAMTDRIRDALTQVKRPDTQVTVANPEHGPVSIESAYDEALAGPPVLGLVRKANAERYDAVIIACFSDPVLDAAKEVSDALVLGIEETSMHLAAMLGHKFSIITPLARRLPTRDVHVRLRGLECAFASARSLDMAVLEMEANPERTMARLLETARAAVDEDGAEVIILGCGGLTGYAGEIERQVGAVVIDPTAAALKLAEALVDLGIRHSKVRRFATPPRKEIH